MCGVLPRSGIIERLHDVAESFREKVFHAGGEELHRLGDDHRHGHRVGVEFQDVVHTAGDLRVRAFSARGTPAAVVLGFVPVDAQHEIDLVCVEVLDEIAVEESPVRAHPEPYPAAVPFPAVRDDLFHEIDLGEGLAAEKSDRTVVSRRIVEKIDRAAGRLGGHAPGGLFAGIAIRAAEIAVVGEAQGDVFRRRQIQVRASPMRKRPCLRRGRNTGV